MSIFIFVLHRNSNWNRKCNRESNCIELHKRFELKATQFVRVCLSCCFYLHDSMGKWLSLCWHVLCNNNDNNGGELNVCLLGPMLFRLVGYIWSGHSVWYDIIRFMNVTIHRRQVCSIHLVSAHINVYIYIYIFIHKCMYKDINTWEDTHRNSYDKCSFHIIGAKCWPRLLTLRPYMKLFGSLAYSCAQMIIIEHESEKNSIFYRNTVSCNLSALEAAPGRSNKDLLARG